MIKIKPGNLSDAIEKELESYEKEVREELQKSGEETAKDIVKTLKETSPKSQSARGGRYAKGWRLKKEASPGAGTRYLIHNKTDYQLTHLLEFGHAKSGGGRTRAIPHIKPAEEKAKNLFEKKIRSKL